MKKIYLIALCAVLLAGIAFADGPETPEDNVVEVPTDYTMEDALPLPYTELKVCEITIGPKDFI